MLVDPFLAGDEGFAIDEVVITGVGAVTALGVGADQLIDRWAAGEDGIEDGVGHCGAFQPGDFMSHKEEHRADRFAQLAVGAATEALAQAGWGGGVPYDAYRVACLVSSALGGIETVEQQHDSYRRDGGGAVSPLLVPRMMPNAAAAAVAMRFGLHGPSAAVASACSSGADAIAAGMRLISSGEAYAAVVGGAESAISPFVQAGFRSLGVMSPSGVCRPFDARRDGFVISEGAAVMVLEDGARARERGATILGRVLGCGRSSDAFHVTAPEPTAAAATQAIAAALADAGIIPEDVDYVNAHGTGTPLSDRVETDALKAAFGTSGRRVPVSSAKSAIGHSLGAAGAVEAVATLQALRARVAPPTVGYENPDPDLDLDYTPGSARTLPNGGRRLIGVSNSFGFGGHNIVLVFEEQHD